MDNELEDIRRRAVEFHKLYYGPHNAFLHLNETKWLGRPVQKCPFDLFVFQEIIFETRPDLIIETGTAQGGSALFMANLCQLLGNGKVLTIDTEACSIPEAPIRCIHGSSLATETISSVKAELQLLNSERRVMVVLDSHHGKEHVLEEMETYGKFVSIGNYMIVEDTNINGHPVSQDSGPGPWEAVEEYLSRHDDFVQDRGKEETYLFSLNPGGYLKKIKGRA